MTEPGRATREIATRIACSQYTAKSGAISCAVNYANEYLTQYINDLKVGGIGLEPMKETCAVLEQLAAELNGLATRVEATISTLRDANRAAERMVDRVVRRYEFKAQTVAVGLVAASIGESFDPAGYFVYILWGDASTVWLS